MILQSFNGNIVLESDKRGVISEEHNQITTLFENLVGSMGLGFFFSAGQGGNIGFNTVITPGYDASYSDSAMRLANTEPLITVYLLNLSDTEKAALSSDSLVLPIYASDYSIDTDKVVGYASCYYTATNNKEGVLTNLTGENLINPSRHALAWTWEAGTISGDFNTICVGLNAMDSTMTNFPYYRIQRGVEDQNDILDETPGQGYFMPPGVKSADGTTVITGDTEVLLGDSTTYMYARRILDLTTGVYTILDTTDSRYGMTLYDANVGSSNIPYTDLYYTGGAMYSVLTKSSVTSLSSSLYSNPFYYDGLLYAPYGSPTKTELRAYTTAGVYTSSSNVAIEDINIPSFLSTSYLRIYNYGSYYIVNSRYADVSVVCSNPMDIAGSIVKILVGVFDSYAMSVAYIDGKGVFFASETDSSLYKNRMLPTSTKTSTTTVTNKGLKITTESMGGNMLSFKTYDEDQTITNNEKFTVKYYYTFGS